MPKPESRLTVPVTFLRKLFNLTDQRIAQLAEEGVIVKVARGRYDAWASVEGYVRFLQERKSRSTGGTHPDSYDGQRTRLFKAKADIEETKAAAIKGEFHNGECIAAVMNEGLSVVRTRLLALPTVAAPQVADISDANQCLKILTDFIYEALSEVSKYDGREVVARYLKQQVEEPEEQEDNEKDAT